MTDFLVAALQITSTSNVEANFAAAEEQIELASRRGAELIGLPENFAFLGDDTEKVKLSGELSIKCTNFLKTMSQRYQVFLLGGGYPVPAEDDTHIFNRSALYGKDGLIIGQYDKIHLFDVDLPDGNLYKESSTLHNPGISIIGGFSAPDRIVDDSLYKFPSGRSTSKR